MEGVVDETAIGTVKLTPRIKVRTGPIGTWFNRREFDAVRKYIQEEGENLKYILEIKGKSCLRETLLRTGGDTDSRNRREQIAAGIVDLDLRGSNPTSVGPFDDRHCLRKGALMTSLINAVNRPPISLTERLHCYRLESSPSRF